MKFLYDIMVDEAAHENEPRLAVPSCSLGDDR